MSQPQIFPCDNLCDVTKWRENLASSIILVKNDVWSERGFEKVTYFDFYEFQMQQEKLRRSFVALFNLFHGLCSHAFSKNAIRKLPKFCAKNESLDLPWNSNSIVVLQMFRFLFSLGFSIDIWRSEVNIGKDS